MKRTESGFTLVELLVVITVIGILMGLLIPAVNSARETARRSQCATNMKNFALAAVQHENSKGQFPGYIQDFGLHESGTDPSDPSAAGIPRHKKLGTWGVALMPWMDAQPTYEHWTQDRYPIILSATQYNSRATPNLAIFQCPSDPVNKGLQSANSYVYNNGMSHLNVAGGSVGGIDFENSQNRNNGIGNSKYNVNGALAHVFEGPKVRLDDLKDGQGFTMIVSENVQARPWHHLGLASGPDAVGPGNLVLAGVNTDVEFNGNLVKFEMARYVHGMVWHYEDDGSGVPWNQNGTGAAVAPQSVSVYHKINGAGSAPADRITVKKMLTAADARALARPSSAHVDGVNAAFADGATRFVNESIDYRVYQALLTPRGKSSNVPWKEFVITDELE